MTTHIAAWSVLSLALVAFGPAWAGENDTRAGMDAYNARDYASAFRFFSRESGLGNAEAEASLGILYLRGHGVAPDAAMADRLLADAAAHGSSNAMSWLGSWRYYARDFPRAISWDCEAMRLGNRRAANNLAILLNDASAAPHDREEALRLWQIDADLGHPNAMANLGMALMAGDSVDIEDGWQWLERAAGFGVDLAQKAIRQHGDKRPLPPVIEWNLIMLSEPSGRAITSKYCPQTIA